MEIQPIVRLLLGLHVAAGMLALVSGPMAMVLAKGGRGHRRWGQLFFWAMFVIFVSALCVLIARPNVFLLVIAILSFYSAFSGYRVLYRKRPTASGANAGRLDWAAALIALVAGASFIVWGLLTLTTAPPDWLVPFAILGMVFGLSLAATALTDLRGFRQRAPDRHWWWYYHMSRMLGAYIAAVTAFVVQNVSPLLAPEYAWLTWVAPTAIGSPAISYWVRHYRQKFDRSAVNLPTPAAIRHDQLPGVER